MIIDLQKFSETERPFWVELESVLDRMESGAQAVMTLEQVRRFQYLYERTSADLARIVTFSPGRAPLKRGSGPRPVPG